MDKFICTKRCSVENDRKKKEVKGRSREKNK